jgi:hypothetical protein
MFDLQYIGSENYLTLVHVAVRQLLPGIDPVTSGKTSQEFVLYPNISGSLL